MASCTTLVNGGPPPRGALQYLWLVGFAFLFTPINNYINARMSGIAGQHAGGPLLVSEAAIFALRLPRVNIWFAPTAHPQLWSNGRPPHRKPSSRGRSFTPPSSRTSCVVFPLHDRGLLCLLELHQWDLGAPIRRRTIPTCRNSGRSSLNSAPSGRPPCRRDRVSSSSPSNPASLASLSLPRSASSASLELSASAHNTFTAGLGAMVAYPHNAVLIFLGAVLGRYVFAKKFRPRTVDKLHAHSRRRLHGRYGPHGHVQHRPQLLMDLHRHTPISDPLFWFNLINPPVKEPIRII